MSSDIKRAVQKKQRQRKRARAERNRQREERLSAEAQARKREIEIIESLQEGTDSDFQPGKMRKVRKF